MKYVIDIDLDNPVHDYGGTKTYVDATNGTMWELSPAMRDKMRSFDNEIAAAEKRGAEKAWELARKIVNMFSADRIECFGKHYHIPEVLSVVYSIAKEKYETWKREKEAFHVGDEVENDEGRTAYVLVPDLNETDFVAFLKEYESPQCLFKKEWHKTGISSKSIKEFVRLAAEQMDEKR